MPVVRINAEKDARCTQSVVQLQGDTRTTMVRFIVNRYDGGVDLAGLVWLIKTTNAAGVPDAWEPEMVENAGEKIVIDWLIQGSVNDADGLTEYELNGLGYEADGKAIKWVGGKGTVSVRKSYHSTFGDDADGFSNLEKLIIYVNGELQDTVAAVERAEAAATAAAEAAADSIWTSKPQGLSFGQQLQAQENIGLLEVVKNLTEPVEAEGNPVRMENLVGGLPFDSVVTVLEPKQAGSWKNLLPYIEKTTKNGVTFETLSDGGVHISGTATALTLAEFACNIVLNGSYVFSMGNKEVLGDALQMRLIDSANSQGNTNFSAANADAYIAMNVTKTVKKFVIRVAASTTYNVTIYPMLEAGTVKTAFEPAGDVFPISGWTGAKMTRMGRNVLPNAAEVQTISGVTFTPNADGSITVNGTAAATVFYALSEAAQCAPGEYVLRGAPAGGGYETFAVRAIVGGTSIFDDYGSGESFGIGSDSTIQGYIVIRPGYTASNLVFYPGVYFQSDPKTEYEPYQVSAYSADFGQTVYGGTLDWQTGVLKADRAIVVFNGTEAAWVRHDASGLVYINALQSPELPVQGQGSPYGVCSHYRRTTANSYLDMRDGEFATGLHQFSSVTAYAIFKDATNGASVDAWKAYLAAQAAAGTPVQVVYKLAAPIEIPLTPQEIKQLEGTNTLYGDGSIAIIGRQKPDLVLVSRIEALESAILNA